MQKTLVVFSVRLQVHWEASAQNCSQCCETCHALNNLSWALHMCSMCAAAGTRNIDTASLPMFFLRPCKLHCISSRTHRCFARAHPPSGHTNLPTRPPTCRAAKTDLSRVWHADVCTPLLYVDVSCPAGGPSAHDWGARRS